MLGASLLPARLRHEHKHTGPTLNPSYLNKQITNVLQWFSRSAFTHPIHTIVSVALLASTCYVGVLEGSLLDHTSLSNNIRSTDLASLASAGRKLQLGDETSWRWKIDPAFGKDRVEDAQQLVLLTLVFPDSLSNTAPRNAPLPKEVFTHENKSVQLLPPTGNPLHSISKDTSLAFAVPYENASTCLDEVQEITVRSLAETAVVSEGQDIADSRRWIMNAAKTDGGSSGSSLAKSARSAWTGFVDLLKNAETLDIVIMILGYLAMHLTFVSLFMSMKHMGSNFWLATSVLISSVFAFLFGLIVTTKLGVPTNLVLLSEGLPFLVVTIGFEKPIILTKAVLAASSGHKRLGSKVEADMMNGPSTSKTIQSSLHNAVRDKGFEIMRDYAIEITILVLGAFSGVQGGLTQFCFLAAWILFFDAILLFTFYTAILSVKLEINRIKRHVATSRALQEEGISRRVAENVATNEELSRSRTDDQAFENNAAGRRSIVFGKKARDSSIPKFKVLMVTGFLLINTVNLCTIPFRSSKRAAAPAVMTGFSNVLSPPSLDPFKVAQNGLEFLYHQAFEQDRSIMVTVLPPIKYDMNLSEQAPGGNEDNLLDGEYTDHLLDYVVGGRVVEGVLKSLEDPIVSKWIILALTISVVLNGYLFNAARWTIKEPRGDAQAATGHQNRAQAPIPDKGPRSQGPEPVSDEKSTIVNENVPVNTQLGKEPRTPAELEQMLKDRQAAYLTDSELTELTVRGKIPGYALEKTLDNARVMTKLESLTRAVKIRRALVSRTPATSEYTSRLEKSDIPYENYNYENVHGACCENVIGYMPIPLGVAGPMIIDGQSYYLPMATTEGVLVASTNRGCKAINSAGGATTVLTGDGMTRGPCCGFETLARAGAAKIWLDSEDGQKTMRRAFNSTSRFARLQTLKTALAGTYLYIRFKTTTGDAMGMNMISKGVECALNVMMNESGFEDMSIISLSGNYCIDKKPSAINWIDGRGKSVVAEAIIPGDVVRSVLKSDVNALVELNTSKNFIGSAMAGSIGGNNAHAANIVTAMFIATGQDPAQNVESSNCITIMRNLNGNLQISVSMPCIEVGTIGGGTVLEPQGACLDLLGVRGAHSITPGTNARQLARIVAAAVLAGELSLCSALAAGHLVKAHMAHNRSAVPTRSSTPVAAAVSSAPSKGQMAEGLSMTSVR